MKPKQIPLRQYTQQEVAAFLRKEDQLDPETAQIANPFLTGDDHAEHSEQEKQAA